MITREEVRRLEEASGQSQQLLMETAGRAIVKILIEKKDISNRRVLVCSSHGNNGGDGFVVARLLADSCEVDVLFVGDEAKMSRETSANYKKVDNDARIQFVSEETVDFSAYDLIIDALTGIGFRGQLRPKLQTLIENVNASNAYTVSIDVPSGINADTGEGTDTCIKSDLIVTIHDLKPGLASFKDIVEVVDIGLKN